MALDVEAINPVRLGMFPPEPPLRLRRLGGDLRLLPEPVQAHRSGLDDRIEDELGGVPGVRNA